MICQKCKAEYVDGITVCADCNIELIPLSEFIDYDAETVSLADWKPVYTSNDPLETEMVKSNLDGAGIKSFIFSKEDRMRLNLSYIGASPIQLLVKEADREEALLIINDINNTQITEEE